MPSFSVNQLNLALSPHYTGLGGNSSQVFSRHIDGQGPGGHGRLFWSSVPAVFLCVYFVFFNLFIFIFGCVGSSLLHAAFSSCSKRGLLFIVVCRLIIVVASLVAEHGL